jgi:3-hydroxyisobutyrate dehydrogenase
LSEPRGGEGGGGLTPPAAIGFVGLGQMGAPMARHLAAAGYRVKAFDTAEAARRRFADESGVAAAGSAMDACTDVRAVITMLPNGRVVREALLGGEGGGGGAAIRAAGRGTLVIDMSSSSPIDTESLGAALAPLGIGLVDAPVSGGVRRAVDGTLAIMAGGEASDVERATPLLKAMGASIFATGPLGSGHAMKALNNFVSAAGLAAAAEAILVGRRFGLDPELMVDVLNASTGRNNSTEHKLKQQILSEKFAAGFSIGLMAKDLATAAELARHLGIAAPMSEMSERLWREARDRLGDGADHTAIYNHIRDLSGERPGG